MEMKEQSKLAAGMLVVVSGPSGAGKGTVCRALLDQMPQMAYSISVTTRSPRLGEQDGVNYHYLSRDTFMQMIQQGELLEWAEVYGNYYGTPRAPVEEKLRQGRDVLLEIDVQGALQVKQRFPQGIFVFVVPPSLEELRRRITGRGTDTFESINYRLGFAMQEIAAAHHYDYVVVNDEVDLAAAKIQAILTAERCRPFRNENVLQSLYSG